MRERHRAAARRLGGLRARRDHTATEVLDPDVGWYGVGEPNAEGACHNREQARAFIRRALEDGVSTELLDIRDAGEHRLVLIVYAHVPTDWGERGTHGEVVTVRDGKVTEMVVYPTVDDAVTAARLPTASGRRTDPGPGTTRWGG